MGVLFVAGLAVVAFVAIQGGLLAGLDLGSWLHALAPGPQTAATATPTTMLEATAPILPGPSPTTEPTIELVSPTGTADATANCLAWDQVTVEDEGQTLCVFGVVAGRYTTAEFPIVVYFSSEPGAFIIVDRTTPHPDVDPGVCVMVIGEVEVMSRVRPVIDAQGEILFCQ
jgi:hypothetical protein